MKVVYLGDIEKNAIEKRLQVIAASGKLSRYHGTVTEVLDTCNDYEKNLKIVKNVVGYGHRSILEHDYLVFALEDVTPIVEQTLISYRLTSFTIKSRRNVDFSDVGYYIPDFKDKNNNILPTNDGLKEIYKDHMDYLFNTYNFLTEKGFPLEDCRYVLPYSYHSNIIMGCDANELIRITTDLKHNKITELQNLGNELEKMIENVAPHLVDSIKKEDNKDYYKDQYEFLNDYEVTPVKRTILKDVKLIKVCNWPDLEVLISIIANRYGLAYKDALKLLIDYRSEDSEVDKKLFNALKNSKNQRELEQVNLTYEMSISLASLTHLTRHRMQSLLIPEFTPIWNLEDYIIPKSIESESGRFYDTVYDQNKLIVNYFKMKGVRDEDLVYFYLSGNTCNVSTTMNAKNLLWISRMRCCNKAQWEIRDIVNKMVELAKSEAPLIGSLLGPYCEIMGYCPEGKDSCKNRDVVRLERKR